MKKVIERRLEFLKLEAEGFSLIEIVKELSQKYHKTERTIYYDAETRGTWQPLYSTLFDREKARLLVINRYQYLYREASFNYQKSDTNKKPTYLKLMFEFTKNLADLLGLENLAASKVRQNQELTNQSLQLEQLLKEVI